jgi:hypothetical protein
MPVTFVTLRPQFASAILLPVVGPNLFWAEPVARLMLLPLEENLLYPHGAASAALLILRQP